MNNGNKKLVLFLVIFICVCLTTCSNSIMEKWWEETQQEEEPRSGGEPPVIPEGESFIIVTFQANGGTPIPGNQNIVKGGKISKVPSMINSIDSSLGFGGWYTNIRFIGEPWNFAVDTVGTNSITLYARWDSSVCTVNFHTNIQQVVGTSNGETSNMELLLEPQHIAAGGKIVEPEAINHAELDKDGRKLGFAGWYRDNSFSGEPWNFAADTVGYTDIDLYAKWATPSYEVRFQANGGNPEPITQDVYINYKVIEPYAMNRTGYGFGGWYIDPAFSVLWDFNANTVNADMTLYAKWVTTIFTVKFDAGGGTPAPGNQTAAYGTKINRPDPMYKTGYGFGGWYREDLSTLWVFSDDIVTGDMTLYARWDRGAYTVTFVDVDYNVALPQAQHILEYSKAVEPPPRDRPFHTFDGWYKDADNDEIGDFTLDNWWDFNEDTVNRDISLYAHWVGITQEVEAWVPTGAFIMGDDTVSGAKPAHKVRVSGFFISKTLVTQFEYETLTGKNPSHFNWADGDLLPVECVSWYDAIEYCNFLSILEGFDPVYSLDNETDPNLWDPKGPAWDNVIMDTAANGYRLPTEAEWEYAARGGNGSPGNFIYSGSNNADEVAWYMDNSDATHPVGEKMPNSFGIYDMSGNVYEWCWDRFDSEYYAVCKNQPNPVLNPLGPASGTRRVRRGGCWSNTSANVRSVVRQSFPPDNATYVMGIRIIRCP